MFRIEQHGLQASQLVYLAIAATPIDHAHVHICLEKVVNNSSTQLSVV